MNKLIFKVMFAVLAFVTVGLGSYKMYGSYRAANMSEEELLMMENVLALSEPGDSDGTLINVRGDQLFKCWRRVWKETKPCDNPEHPTSCRVSTYSYSGGTKITYECGGQVSEKVFKNNPSLRKWNYGDDRCNYSTSATTPVGGSQPTDSKFHSCQPRY